MWAVAELLVALRSRIAALGSRLAEDRGEGVISAAIAILIVALIGALLWGAARGWFDSMEGTVDTQIESIGE